MRRAFSISLLIGVTALVAWAIWAPNSYAYQQFNLDVGTGNCATCHGEFLADGYVSRTSQDEVPWNIGGVSSLHNIHRDFMLPGGGNQDCTSCHVEVDGTIGEADNPLLDVSGGGATGNRTLSCVGCHGRVEDLNIGQIGAGLRQHHTNGATGAFCGGCHQDNDPATFTPVGENIAPPNYTDTDISNLGWDPCNVDVENPIFPGLPIIGALGLDNDGDLLYDEADPDCVPCAVDADCDDGVFCNGAETCDTATGTCVAGTPVDCDDGVGCTVDSCDEANDTCLNMPDDASCDDGDVCTGLETCDPILDCQAGTALDCDDQDLCTTDSCDPLTGCANVPVVCPAGEQCDPADGICKVPPECTVDADCDDTLFCNGAETCDTATGTCQAGTPPDCDDGVGCTVDTCDEVNDTCVSTPDDASCDDGQFCNGIETCDPVNDCQAGTPVDCDDGVGCTDDTCDEVNDTCVSTPDDASCDDNNVCNGIETCDPTLDCQAGTALDCEDGNLCTTDSCDPLTGCANVPVQCPAGEQCDPADGICKPEPECTVDADCDDGFFCDGAETCDTATGTCQAGTPPDCDDGVVCTVDTCDEVNDTCVSTPDDASCDDGDVCNGLETCDPVNDCQPGEPLVCDDGNLCTTDSCDPVAGCVFTPVECPAGEQCDPADGECKVPPECTVDADCDDGMFCNGAETCDTATGTCQAGTPVDCDDGVDCTVDTCDEVNDECVNTPDDTACPDDGLFCTGDEICDPAAGCVSTGDPCPPNTVCNEDTDTCDTVSEKVTLCHKGKKTITIKAAAVSAHLRHGDTLGPCP